METNVINFAKSYVDDLHPRAITRDSDWGIPVPLLKRMEKCFTSGLMRHWLYFCHTRLGRKNGDKDCMEAIFGVMPTQTRPVIRQRIYPISRRFLSRHDHGFKMRHIKLVDETSSQ